MKAFKFTVGSSFKTLPSDPRYSVANCAAVVLAASEESARAALAFDLSRHGDVPWHEVATVTEIPIAELSPTVLLVVQL